MTVKFIFEDIEGNELYSNTWDVIDIKEAKVIAKELKATSKLNDLHKIVIKKIKK